ncbi:hypothetical protein [Roseibium sp. MB-4]
MIFSVINVKGKPGRKDLSLAQQHMFLSANPIVVGHGQLKHTALVWDITVKPTPLSRAYSVSLKYKPNGTPEVFVIDPDIQLLAGDRNIPHVYNDPLRLCLYLPGSGQWHPSKRIDETIVPWTFAWLYYFEEWLVSDEWKGGGVHPSDEDDSPLNRHLRRSVR